MNALSYVGALSPYVPGKPIEELERELGIRNAIKLASNENPLGPSPFALSVLRSALGDQTDLARYPDGGGTLLRHALARHLDVDAAQITLGNGSNDVLDLAARVYAGPADEVVYSEHAFAVYAIATQAVGARAVVVKANDYGHDLDAMAAAISERTRLVFLANPNNPTGTWFDRDHLARFLSRVPSRIPVVLDEAYVEYVEAADFPDGIAFLKRYPNLIVTRTFSKAYGLAGLRVGYAVSSPVVADLLNRVRQPFNVNSLAQQAAVAALEDTAFLARSRACNRAGLAQLRAGLDALGYAALPSMANFLCVALRRPAGPVYQSLLRAGVIVRPVDSYGMPEHLRVSVGLPEENARFLTALAAA